MFLLSLTFVCVFFVLRFCLSCFVVAMRMLFFCFLFLVFCCCLFKKLWVLDQLDATQPSTSLTVDDIDDEIIVLVDAGTERQTFFFVVVIRAAT